ncbi:hypothetical protein ATN81_14970 [Agrobacterium pusense]|nr:hypothetical protein ATN81_14970 [Agrobacterium pusense]OJH58584.1 hypothetical protein BA725_16700 [Agrobacterium pusense]
MVHNYWNIRTANGDHVISADEWISFETVVDFNDRRLHEAAFLHDNLTKKLLCIEIVNNRAVDREVGANLAFKVLNQFDWCLRWRNGISVRRFSDLTAEDWQNYEARCNTTDLLDLVPIIERLDTLANDPHYSLPFVEHGRRKFLGWERLAAEIGVTEVALSKSKTFRDAALARLPIFLDRSGIAADQFQLQSRRNGSNPVQATELLDPSHRIMAWQCLDRLTASGLLNHDPLQIKIPTGTLRKKKRRRSRTSTLLPHDMFRLMVLSVKWVVEYSDHIIFALRRRAAMPGSKQGRNSYLRKIEATTAELQLLAPDGLRLSAHITKRASASRGTIILPEALKYLFVACAILIGCFGGRRHIEVASLRAGSLESSNGLFRLNIYIAKTLQDLDHIPMPAVIEPVVRVLEELSKLARERTGTPWLFRFQEELADGRTMEVSTDFEHHLTSFVEESGLPPPAGETSWKLNYHMFRKGFAIFYYHANLWGGFDGTNRMLRHTSDDMSRIYLDEEDLGALEWIEAEVIRLTEIAVSELSPEEETFLSEVPKALSERKLRREAWNQVRQEHFVSTMMGVFDAVMHPIGKGAATMLDELKVLEDRALARIQMTAAPTNRHQDARAFVLADVQRLAVDHFMEPIPGGLGFCLYKRGSVDQSMHANCLKDKSAARRPWSEFKKTGIDNRPDYAFSGLYACLDCPFFAAFEASQKLIIDHQEGLALKVATAATPALEQSAAEYVAGLSELIDQAKAAVDGKQRTTY